MAILILAGGCLLVGFVLYLPFLLWFRRRRRLGKTIRGDVRYTRSGLLHTFAMLITFFGGLGMRTAAPQSWFASWIPGDLGAIRWGIGVVLVFSVLEMALRRADVTFTEPAVNPPTADASGANAKPRRLWDAFTFLGVPVLVRGSLPTGGLLVACFANSSWAGTVCYCLAFIVLVLVHELGHFLAARTLGLRVFALVVSGHGGSCLTQVPRGVRDTFVLYAAGLMAQSVLLVLTLATIAVQGVSQSLAWRAVEVTFTIVNLIVVAMNLVPGKIRDDLSNDGAILWDLLLHAAGRKPHPFAAQHAASIVFPRETRLVTVDGMMPPDFEEGVEILNDDRTPMEFVVAVLERHLGLDHQSAVAATNSIHTRGGHLFPLADGPRAEEVARSVTQEARDRGYPLTCRPARPAASGAPSPGSEAPPAHREDVLAEAHATDQKPERLPTPRSR
ncbi:MAG: ATP-dependent Clp protease adaptor ClpS [Burkholderiaceae bacterium]